MDSLSYILGERKYVRLFVYSFKSELFHVRNAEYKLINPAGETEQSGQCDVTPADNGTNVFVLAEPKMEGDYVLKIQYEIGQELMKKSIKIEVIADD